MDELEMLEAPITRAPCEATALQLAAHGSSRGMSLSTLKAPKKTCVWCAGPLTGRQQRWCSDECVKSAQFRCYPQDPAAKLYRLIFVQHWACARCGESYEEELRAKIRKEYDDINKIRPESYYRGRKEGDPIQQVTLFRVGYGTGDRWQTDHIVPLHLGGAGIDPLNLQTLCVKCHLAKTKDDLSGRI